MMADFDPGAYLKEKASTPVAFDPNAYLKGKTSTSTAFDPDAYLKGKAIPHQSEVSIGRQIRNVVGPTIEMLGSVGGGVVGASSGALLGGPPGAVAGAVGGAGLGYGISKEMLEYLDTAMGWKQSRQGMENVTEPLKNIAEGAAWEAGGQALGGAIAGGVKWWRDRPRAKAAKLAAQSVEGHMEDALNALRTAPEGLTGAQALAGSRNPTAQALVKRAMTYDPHYFGGKVPGVTAAQTESGANALVQLSGGVTATEARAATEAAKKEARAALEPVKNNALFQANMGQINAGQEANALYYHGGSYTGGELTRPLYLSWDKTFANSYAKAAAGRGIKGAKLSEFEAQLVNKAPQDVIEKEAQRFGIDPNAGTPASIFDSEIHGDGPVKQLVESLRSKGYDHAVLGDIGYGTKAMDYATVVFPGTKASESVKLANRTAKSSHTGAAPLKSESLIANVENILRDPELAGNADMRAAVKRLSADIKTWVTSTGAIDARALDAIRKNSVNAAINSLHKGDPTAQKQATTLVMSKIKPVIIDAIEEAGGEGYKRYLAKYSESAQEIAKTKLTGEAQRLFKESPEDFVKLVKGESVGTVEKFLGKGNYDIGQELAEETMAVLKKQATTIERGAKSAEEASQGRTALLELLEANTSKFRLPWALGYKTIAINEAIEAAERKLGRETMLEIAKASRTAKGLEDLLKNLPPEHRRKVASWASDPSKWGLSKTSLATSTSLAGKNAMVDANRNNQNTLAE